MISQYLSSVSRAVEILVIRTSTLSVTSTNIHRTAHSNIFRQERLPRNVRRTVEKTMGPRPKQPLPPYFRFMQQIRSQVEAEYPHLKKNKLYPIFSERWKSLQAEEKATLTAEYRNDMDKYVKEIWEYNRGMNWDDVQRMQEKLTKDEDRQQIKLYQQQARELNKPKKPLPSFLKFLHSKSDRRPGEMYKAYMKRMSSTWWSLSETEREKYKTKPAELKKYQKAKLKWETNLPQLIAVRDG